MGRSLVFLMAALGLGLAQGGLTLYTSEILGDVNALVETFRKANPGAEVRVFRSGTGEVVAKLRAELEAGNPQPDLLWVADEAFFRELARSGRLRRVPPTVPGYPLRYAYGGGLYYEVRLIHNAIALNAQRLGGLPEPRAWGDLLQPEYRGQVAMPNPNFSGAALSTLATLTQRYGFGYFQRLKENGLRVEQSNPVLLQRLAEGQYALALMVDFNVRGLAQQGAPLRVVYPRDGAILVPTPIGVLSTARNPELAERFLRFLLSPEAQALFAERGYIPVMPGAPRPAGVEGPIPAIPSATDYLLANRQDLLSRFNALFGLR